VIIPEPKEEVGGGTPRVTWRGCHVEKTQLKINSPWTIEITLSDHLPVPSHLEQDALDVLSHVTRLREARGVGDDQRYVDELRERLHQQSLTATRRSDDDDVALVQLAILNLRTDIVVRIRDGPPRG